MAVAKLLNMEIDSNVSSRTNVLPFSVEGEATCLSFNENHFIFCELQQNGQLRIFEEGANIASAKLATISAFVVDDHGLRNTAPVTEEEGKDGGISRVESEENPSKDDSTQKSQLQNPATTIPSKEELQGGIGHHKDIESQPVKLTFVESEKVEVEDSSHDGLPARVLSINKSQSHADVQYFDANFERVPVSSLRKRVPKPFCVCIYQRSVRKCDVYFMDQFKVGATVTFAKNRLQCLMSN